MLTLAAVPRNVRFIAKIVVYVFLISSTLRLLPHRCLADTITEKELTFAMIKPDGVSGNYTDSIMNRITGSGFTIVKEELAHLDEDTVKNFYEEHSSKSFFQDLVHYVTRVSKPEVSIRTLLTTFDPNMFHHFSCISDSSGRVMIMILEKENAVADWRALIGPTDSNVAKITHPLSIRAMCGLDQQRNCVHGSDSLESAAREISLLFKQHSQGDLEFNWPHDEL